MMPTLKLNANGPGLVFHEDGPLMAVSPSSDDPLQDLAWLLYGLDMVEECRRDQGIELRWLFARRK